MPNFFNGMSCHGFRKPASSWGTRHTFVAISFVLAALNYSQRFNMSIVIVAMVRHPGIEGGSGAANNIMEGNTSQYPEIELKILNFTGPAHPDSLPNSTPDSRKNPNPTFNWDERDQGLILGSFFWGYVISQIPSGFLAHRYGGKWIVAGGMLLTGILSLCLPQLAILGGRDLVIVVRILQGMAEGFIVPAMINLEAKWMPAEERAHLSAITFSGLPFGAAMTMLLSGVIIPVYGWPLVLYIPGILSILLVFIWIWKIYSSPDQHPNITTEERMYITNSINPPKPETPDEGVAGVNNLEDSKLSWRTVPYKQIICSAPVWAVFISQFCSAWGNNMLKSEGPKYLHSALHFSIHENGYWAALLYLAQFGFTVFVGKMSDYLQERKYISMLTARKLCNTLGQWGIALTFLGLILSGTSRLPAVTFYILSGLVNGAMNSGAHINVVDITPNYAGVVEAVINSIANVAGFGAPYVAGLILFYEPSIIGWRFVFAVPVAINLIGNSVFLIWADAKVQHWNDNTSNNCDKSPTTAKPLELDVIAI